MGARSDAQVVIGFRKLELFKKDTVHPVIIMLTRVDEDFLKRVL
jgi:hypothetical protein